MACFHPITGYRSPAGKVVFNPSAGWGDLPVKVACGQCSGCRLERSRQWAVRCMHENQMHQQSSFVTLTYNDANLPETGSLVLADWQSFAKRLRRQQRFRFFHCGEYGEQLGRPHYHAIIFGHDFASDRKVHSESHGNPLYTSEQLTKTWGKGHALIGAVTFQSAAYVARYIMKKVTGDLAEDHYTRVSPDTGEVFTIKPEYTTMSRRPGIGSTWLAKYGSDVFPSDEVIMNGKAMRPPKFYDSQYEITDPEGFASMKQKRISRGRKHRSNNTYERLRVRETIHKQKVSNLKRHL